MTKLHYLAISFALIWPICGCQKTESDEKSGRNMSNRPDDFEGFQVQVVYMLPAGQEDRELDINGKIKNMVSSMNTWLEEKTEGSTFRFDTYNGEPDILFHRLEKSNANLAATEKDLFYNLTKEFTGKGLVEKDKIYAVVYDGSSLITCGNGLVGTRFSMMYLQSVAPRGYNCIAAPEFGASATEPHYLEIGMIHEIVHTLGYAPACAPNHYAPNPYHVSDKSTDLMYGAEEGWMPEEIDADHDDYYKAYVPGCYDLANSAIWNPQPDTPELPPYWQDDPTTSGEDLKKGGELW